MTTSPDDGGDVSVTSVEGARSTFASQLPIATEEQAPRDTARESA